MILFWPQAPTLLYPRCSPLPPPQFPGVLQWILSLVVFPLLTSLSLIFPLRHERRMRHVSRCLVASEMIATLWLILQYAVQLEFLKTNIPDNVATWLKYAGLPFNDENIKLEESIRYKFLVLLAAGLKRRSAMWLKGMPLEVRASALPGHLCPVFWPPPGSRQGVSEIDKLFASLQVGWGGGLFGVGVVMYLCMYQF